MESEARTRSRCPCCRLWGLPGGLAESSGSSRARWVAVALSRERAVSWSRTPVGRRAGLQRARGRGSQASGAFATDGEVEGGRGRDTRAAVTARCLPCAGERATSNLVPPTLALLGPPPFLTSVLWDTYWWPRFTNWETETQKREETCSGSQCESEPEPRSQHRGGRLLFAPHFLPKAGGNRVKCQPG